MTIATTNKVFTDSSGAIQIVYTGQTIDPSFTPWTPPVIPAAQLLAAAQVAQVSILTAAYNAAIQVSVSYMGTTFQADSDSVAKIIQVLAAMTPAGATPTGFYWVDSTNSKVLMTLAQVQGLAQAIMNQGWTAFQNLQTKKASVNSATTVSAAQAVVW